MPVAGGG
ncbi:hypothetical protein YPPY06_0710, partial [Yersinia pestis PY-06]